MKRSIRTLAVAVSVLTMFSACREGTPPALTAPAKLVQMSGNDQAVVNAPAVLPQPLVVQVLDPRDQPVAGVAVEWTPQDPTASVTPASSVTDRQGLAQATWTVGAREGVQTVTATTPQIPGVIATFRATNLVLGIDGAVTVATRLPITLATQSRGEESSPVGAVLSSARNDQIRTAGARTIASPGGAHRLIVQFRPAAVGVHGRVAADGSSLARTRQLTEQALGPLRRNGTLELVEPSPAILAARVTVPAGASTADVIAALRRDIRVESVVEDAAIQVLPGYSTDEFVPGVTGRAVNAASSHGDALFPNDPLLLPQLWHYNMVEAPRAWSTTTGSDNVLVAVVDDGIRFDHPAIAANLTDDGYNFVTEGPWLDEPEPLCVGNTVVGTTDIPEAGYGPDPTAPDDLRWTGSCWQRSTLGNHGLHVAGTIGAVGNDGIGVTGINWRVRIRPVRVLGMIGSGFSFDVAQGVLYAAGLPASDGAGGTVTAPSAARIINMSLGSGAVSPVIRDAVAAAIQAGSLVVASMGNAQSSAPNYPAALPNVMGIVAIGPDLQLASYTNIGPAASLSAPGGNPRSAGTAGVVSSTWNFVTGAPNYAYYSGTSMAAPHVAGVAALLLAANPGMNREQLRARLESTAVPLGSPGRDDRFGWGVVNAHRALHNITAATHPTFVRVHSATTGDTVRTAAVGPNGSFSFKRLPEGSYHVVAGETESAAGRVAFRGLRYGWFGNDRGPGVVTVSAAQSPNPNVAIHIGTPREAKPNNTRETATLLLVNSYVLGHVNTTHPEAFFQVQVPTAGTYIFETAGVIGTCGYGIELDTVLTLMSAEGATIAQNDATGMPGSAFCSRIQQELTPGTYFVRVTGSGGARGQFALSVRR